MRNFLLLLGIAICIGLCGCSQKSKSDITLRNDSNSVIAEAKIVICRQTFIARNIKPGEEQTFNYVVKGDSHYQIKVRFFNEHSLEKDDGYVTDGFVFHDIIVVVDANTMRC